MPTQGLSAVNLPARLAQLFQRNGYVRVPREKRRQEIGRRYKKGWEVRLVLRSEEELDEVRRLLQQAGLKPGRPFKKVNRWVQPIYGKQAVDLFPRRKPRLPPPEADPPSAEAGGAVPGAHDPRPAQDSDDPDLRLA